MLYVTYMHLCGCVFCLYMGMYLQVPNTVPDHMGHTALLRNELPSTTSSSSSSSISTRLQQGKQTPIQALCFTLKDPLIFVIPSDSNQLNFFNLLPLDTWDINIIPVTSC